MRKTTRLIGIVILLFVGLLCTQFIGLAPAKLATDTEQFNLKANLALRRTVHHLLQQTGDSTARIEPVQQTNGHTFRVKIDHSFSYNTLPVLLQQSLRLHGITANYDVAVLDCSRGELLLGYNLRDLTDNTGIPCSGRARNAGCYMLQVSFAPLQTPAPSSPIALGWVLAAGGLLTGLGYVFWKRSGQGAVPVPAPSSMDAPAAPDRMLIGQSAFEPSRHLLYVGAHTHTLTYREAKLLQFFSSHTNEVLERDFILKSVWEDEGIIVGRSVDVFVSRLRKMLQPDPTVRIVAVHGVGYRMEVSAANTGLAQASVEN